VKNESHSVSKFGDLQSEASRVQFLDQVRAVMNSNWVDEFNFTQPHASAYPWMWLWDSCFHSIIYAALEDDRTLLEATSLFRWQTSDGMVPHMGYQSNVEFGRLAWGSAGGSTITQPPMYGHMIRVLYEGGWDVEQLVLPATRGLNFLLRRRRLPSGLVGVVHPWETGMDDSPRWAPWCLSGTHSTEWRSRKDEFARSLIVEASGSTIENPSFCVAPASFNALVAFNAMELACVTGDESLRRDGLVLAEILDGYFDESAGTWADTSCDGGVSSSVRTLDALLPALVTSSSGRAQRSLQLILDDQAFGARFGPCGVDQREPSFDPDGYWRGAAWPQLTYLFYVLAERMKSVDIQDSLARHAVESALKSDFAEYFNPLSGLGLGAVPQSWACLPAAIS
jgi:hypothetical protein